MVRPQIADERREQILAAFETCVIRHGLAKTTLADVATECGLPRSLVRYFVGNRADMVGLLIDRMVERGEDGIASLRPKSRTMTTHDLVDIIFGNTLTNDVSNTVVGELWYLSERDPVTRRRLSAMYERIIHHITAQLDADGLGASPGERRDAAFVILSLAYGQGAFHALEMPGANRAAAHATARAVLDALTHTPATAARKKTKTKKETS